MEGRGRKTRSEATTAASESLSMRHIGEENTVYMNYIRMQIQQRWCERAGGILYISSRSVRPSEQLALEYPPHTHLPLAQHHGIRGN